MFDEYIKTLDPELQEIYHDLRKEPGGFVHQLREGDTEGLRSILEFVRYVKNRETEKKKTGERTK